MKIKVIKDSIKKKPIKINEVNIKEILYLEYKYTKKDHENFMNFSGDNSPVHTNKLFAKKNGFKNIIGYAFFFNILVSNILGKIYPGGSELCVRSDSYFIKPFYINDTFLIKIILKKKNQKLKLLNLTINITNQRNEKIYQSDFLLNLNLN